VYSRKVTENNILRAEKIIRERHQLSSRWILRPPNSGEREEMHAHFNSLLDSKGFLTRDFNKEERLWILVESTLCKLDFLYFARNYAKIEDWSAKVVFFNPNIAQQIILDIMAENEELGWALMFMFLKARQLGITTLFQLLLAQRVFFWRNVGAYTGSAEEKKSRAMVGKLEFLWDNLPWWLRPRQTASQAGDFIEFGDINSGLWVQWGNQKQGIGRGATPTIAHLSEVSTFEHPEKLIDAALYRAMHENPFALLALESTANGIGNWWWKTWNFNVKQDARGLARYRPIFLPWYIGTDLYPTEWEYRRRPAPEGWIPPEYVDKHALAAKIYVMSTPILKKAMGEDWEMSFRQKWWYYLNYEEGREMNELHTLLQELPASADEAFQNSNPSVFLIETMNSVRTESNSSVPEGVYQIAGDTIPFIYSDQRVVGDPIATAIHAISNDGVPLEKFELQPVETDGWPDSNPDLKLYMWEGPLTGETYGVYCDPSEGVGEDSSVVGVIKKATPWHPDEQVAEWASNKVGQHDLWAYVFCLCHLYTVRDHTGEWREPLAVIETNIVGDAVQSEMLKRGYGNFYRLLDMTMIGETGAQFNKRPRAIKDRIGWRTDRVNRPKMISLFRKLVRDGNFKVRSPYLVREMATLEYNIDKQRIQASEGQHDDRVTGPAMLLCAWYDPEIYGTVPTAFIEQRSYEASLDRLPAYTGDKLVGRGSRYSEPAPDMSDSRILMYG
jgi:hypothetical protein